MLCLWGKQRGMVQVKWIIFTRGPDRAQRAVAISYMVNIVTISLKKEKKSTESSWRWDACHSVTPEVKGQLCKAGFLRPALCRFQAEPRSNRLVGKNLLGHFTGPCHQSINRVTTQVSRCPLGQAAIQACGLHHMSCPIFSQEGIYSPQGSFFFPPRPGVAPESVAPGKSRPPSGNSLRPSGLTCPQVPRSLCRCGWTANSSRPSSRC